MSTQSITLMSEPALRQEPPAHGADVERTCRDLDCLTRPRFFCGQLLSDQDLDALVDWARGRFRLARYRGGWGVVCGLEMRCDPQNRGRVLVGSGYAVDCCGDDIVLCEEKPVDLSGACSPDGAHRLVVDLFLHAREEETAFQTALDRGTCLEVSSCEPSRVREGCEIVWRPAQSDEDPGRTAARRWQEAYRRCFEVCDRFCDRFGDPGLDEADEVRRFLLDWIAENPLQQFCFVLDQLCELTAEQLCEGRVLTEILFWLVQDCRNAFLRGSCGACLDGGGIPLGRVCLEPGDPDGSLACRVVSTDPYPPWRRPLSRDGAPVLPGYVSLGDLVWRRPEEARAVLASRGIFADETTTFEWPASPGELRAQLEGDLFAGCGGEICLVVLEPPPRSCLSHARVLGFRGRERPVGPGTSTGPDGTDHLPPPGKPPEGGVDHFDFIKFRKRRETLHARGIRTFRDLAAASDEQLRQIFPGILRYKQNFDRWRREARLRFSDDTDYPADTPQYSETEDLPDSEDTTYEGPAEKDSTDSVQPSDNFDFIKYEKRRNTLHAQGIRTFRDLAAASDEELRQIFRGPRPHKKTFAKWRKEARLRLSDDTDYPTDSPHHSETDDLPDSKDTTYEVPAEKDSTDSKDTTYEVPAEKDSTDSVQPSDPDYLPDSPDETSEVSVDNFDFIKRPKRRETLHARGIRTFQDLAAASDEELRQIFPGLRKSIFEGWRQAARERLSEEPKG